MHKITFGSRAKAIGRSRRERTKRIQKKRGRRGGGGSREGKRMEEERQS